MSKEIAASTVYTLPKVWRWDKENGVAKLFGKMHEDRSGFEDPDWGRATSIHERRDF